MGLKNNKTSFKNLLPLYASSFQPQSLFELFAKERESLILLCMREWEANANGGGKHLWTPDVMLCKARVAPSPAVIPLQVSLTLWNWAGKGQEHGPSRVIPPAPAFGRGMRLWDRAWRVQPARDTAVICCEYPCSVCHGGVVLLAANLGCPATYRKCFPIKREVCMRNKPVIFLVATYSRNAAE